MDIPALRTVGYEAATFPQVRDALLASGVRLLLDVRALPASRKPGFSKRLLAAGLADAGIGYVHLQQLGTPKPGRDAVRRGDVAGMQALFRAHMTADRPQAALAEGRRPGPRHAGLPAVLRAGPPHLPPPAGGGDGGGADRAGRHPPGAVLDPAGGRHNDAGGLTQGATMATAG